MNHPPAIQYSLFHKPAPVDPWERHRHISQAAARLLYLAQSRDRTTDLDGHAETTLGTITGRLALDHLIKRDASRLGGPDAGGPTPEDDLNTLAVWCLAVRDVLVTARPDQSDLLVQRATAMLACARKQQWSAYP